ncbi:MAG: pyruvate:ferredoxin (flavodoxin) oxidoreductase [Ruminococcaceae bacterium]|nr:pyruvate:ferredoxin (flavodoxin) oxidoreductase [Oscillospiraceae bacterium]
MERKKISMDGNTAAAHVSYAFTEVAAIYPITPSSNMAEVTDTWSASNKNIFGEPAKNIFGTNVKVVEMQSEAGAAGAVHGSLAAGALTTTYTASQGLLLMIPNMYKIAGELLPCVIHVSARCVASHALNIFGDHSDVYACRQTGFAMMAESNGQEVMDLGAVSHLATIKGRVPFINFFDGFRTSHEITKVAAWDYKDLAEMVDWDAVQAFRQRSLNPETNPVLRGSAENGDIFFQHREACNSYYDALPAIVEEYMDKVNAKLGTDYKLFNYYGAPDADRVIVAMGSVCDVAEEVVDYLMAQGEKVGLVKVRLYRPFVAAKLAEAIPATAKVISVLDRTKEPGSLGEPLYLDVIAALDEVGRDGVKVLGGRYGLGSKDTTPASIFAVYENMAGAKKNHFTIGIVDDVTGHSLDEKAAPNTAPVDMIQCKFWGLGGDGTVGANKNSIKIIGDHTDKFIQAYFQYDSKKTSGITISHLRFGDSPIKSSYYINKADFVACHNHAYLTKYDMISDVKPGGRFLLDCPWTAEELDAHLPASVKTYIAKNNIEFYTINATKIAIDIGNAKVKNTVLQSAFFALAKILPIDEAIEYMKKMAYKSYIKKGQAIVDLNYAAIDAGKDALVKVDVPAAWANAGETAPAAKATGERAELVDFVNEVVKPVVGMRGDSLPVSAFEKYVDGTFPQGAAAYEKRGVAVSVPTWIPENCIQCNNCAFVCPHATIRPFAMTEEEAKAAPASTKFCEKPVLKTNYKFTMAISPMDCMGCTLCVKACPVSNNALKKASEQVAAEHPEYDAKTAAKEAAKIAAPKLAIKMVPQAGEVDQQAAFDYAVAKVSEKPELINATIKGSQFKQPLLEFSGSCAGCAETSYARLITQLFGERMYISNATGCSSIWGGSAPATPYTVNAASGRGPAWANSLFEDNAEHGLGMYLGQKTIREKLIGKVEEMMASDKASDEFKAAAQAYLDTKDNGAANEKATKALVAELEKAAKEGCPVAPAILAEKQYLSKKSVWIFGGDGWAYDIGFGGLDHVIASGEDVNIMVFDTEVYSNTGGQASKASNVGQVAQFAAAGKAIGKKDLAQIAMSYGYVYVAQIAMGADMNQTLKALTEAEAYNGPSIVIGYAPCEMHSIKGGMQNCQAEMKKAVEAGYWQMFRFNPAKKAAGENPFTLDSKAPTASYQDFIMSEARYARLAQQFPERAEELFAKAEANAKAKYDRLVKLGEFYK